MRKGARLLCAALALAALPGAAQADIRLAANDEPPPPVKAPRPTVLGELLGPPGAGRPLAERYPDLQEQMTDIKDRLAGPKQRPPVQRVPAAYEAPLGAAAPPPAPEKLVKASPAKDKPKEKARGKDEALPVLSDWHKDDCLDSIVDQIDDPASLELTSDFRIDPRAASQDPGMPVRAAVYIASGAEEGEGVERRLVCVFERRGEDLALIGSRLRPSYRNPGQ